MIWSLGTALLLSIGSASAQKQVRAGSIVLSIPDTLSVKTGEPMLAIRLSAANEGRDTQSASVRIGPATGWKSINPQHKLTLFPGEHRNLIFNFIRDRSVTGTKWAEFSLHLSSTPGDTQHAPIYLNTETSYKYRFERLGESDIYFEGNEHKKQFSVRVSNEGNVPATYEIQWTLDRFGIRKSQIIALAPAKDSVLSISFNLNKAQLKELTQEALSATLKDDSGHRRLVLWTLWRSTGRAKQHVSSYKSFPLRVELGGLSRQSSSYIYGAVNGSFPLGKERGLQFSYRTQQYTELNYNQEDVFRFSYHSPKLSLYAGQSQHYTNFPVFGNELSAGVRGKRASAEVWYQRPYASQRFGAEQFGGELGYRIRKMKLTHTLNAALDSNHRPAATILDNKISLIDARQLKLSASIGAAAGSVLGTGTGIGADQFAGMSYGSEFQYIGKKLSAYVNLLWTSPDYPGLLRGARRVNASVSQRLGSRFSLSPFYNLNEISYNYSIDTLLNTNRMEYNREKYGLEGKYQFHQLSVAASVGNYRDTRAMDMPKYQYAELRFDFHNKSGLQLGLNSQSGFSAASEERGTPPLWFNSTSANINTNHFSLSGNYYRYPFFFEADGQPAQASYLETMNLMAALQFRIGNCVEANAFYQLARYTMNDFLTHDLGGNLSFRSMDNSLIVRLTGSMPLHASSADNAASVYNRNYVQLSVSKAISMPVFTRKRYFDLNMEMFYDENGNGSRDEGEPAIEDSRVAINERRFKSTAKGKVEYLNLEKGDYAIDLSGLQAAEGFLPPGSHAETVSLVRDTVLLVPFKKAAIITGRVTFKLDELSEIRPVLAGIKVTVADSNGVVGSTLTNSEGVFKISVPAGYYTVSLNPDAFNNLMKPERMSLVADLRSLPKQEVEFTIKQKKREIRLLQSPHKG
jgi:hypothetical protein